MKNLKNQKNFKEKKLKRIRIKMAYYCKFCQLWHYPGSGIYYKHKRYASQRYIPKTIVPRRKRSFWDRF